MTRSHRERRYPLSEAERLPHRTAVPSSRAGAILDKGFPQAEGPYIRSALE